MIESKHVQPLSLGQLITYSLKNGKAIFLKSLLGNLVFLAIAGILTILFYDYSASLGADSLTLYVISGFNNFLAVGVTSVNIFYLLLVNPETSFMKSSIEAFKKSSWVIATLVAATLVYAIIQMVGMTLLIVPGVLVLTYFGIYIQTITFEKKGIISSLSRSRELVKGSFWRVFPMLLVLLLITNIALVLVGAVFLIFFPEYPFVVEVVVFVLSYLIIMPFLASFYVFLYFDLRSRQEAFDYPAFKIEKNRLMER